MVKLATTAKWRHIWRHMLKTRYGTRNIVFSGYFSGHIEQVQSSSSFWKNISKCLRRQSSDTITEKLKNDVYQWWHMTNMGHGIKKEFQNVPLSILNNFNHNKLFRKTKLQGLKHQLSSKISKKWHNDVSKWQYTHQRRDYQMRKIFFPKCLSDYDDQLQPWSTSNKKQVRVLKTA